MNRVIWLLAAFAIVILGVMLFSPVKEESDVVEYNYFEFEEVDGFWQTNVQVDNKEYSVAFRFNPYRAEDVYVIGDFVGFKPGPVYITFDPDSSSEEFKYLALASSELSLHLIRVLGQEVIAACTKNETDACIDRPVVTCETGENVMYLVASAPTQLTLNGSCITVSGSGFDLVKSVDRLLFQWYRIAK